MLKNKFFIFFLIVFTLFFVSCSSTKQDLGEQPEAYTQLWREVEYLTDQKNDSETITFKNNEEALVFLLAEQKNLNSELQKEINYYKELSTQENIVYVAVDQYLKDIDTSELIESNKTANTVTLTGNYDFSSSITVYTYQNGKIYDVFFNPLNITDIKLEPGEELVTIVLGDNENWLCESLASIEDDETCMHIFIRPYNINISTDCEILTNRRNYYLRLYSIDKAQLAVQWRYPYSSDNKFLKSLSSISSNLITTTSSVLAPEVAEAVSSLNFNYEIEGKASWKPVRVFSDTQRTYIQFPNAFLANTETPIPYLKTGTAKEELINFTAKGINYIIPIILSSNQQIILKTEKTSINISLSE